MGVFDWFNQAGKDIGGWLKGAGDTIKNAADSAGGWINQNVVEPTKKFFDEHGEEIKKGLAKGAQIAGNIALDVGKAIPGVGSVISAAQPLIDQANSAIDNYTGLGPGAKQAQGVQSGYKVYKAAQPILKRQMVKAGNPMKRVRFA